MSPTMRTTAVIYACGFAAGFFVATTLAKKKEPPKAKTPISDREAWLSILQTRLMGAWAAAITIDEDALARELMKMGRDYFGPERWAIGHHQFKDPEL